MNQLAPVCAFNYEWGAYILTIDKKIRVHERNSDADPAGPDHGVI